MKKIPPAIPMPCTARRKVLAAAMLTLCSGCGYMVGNGFDPEIRTVSVPVFENDTYRRNIELQLTEAVQKEIQNRTPFRLAKDGESDTRLVGRIVSIRKDVLGETRYDDPRELQFTIMVNVTWEDLRNNRILAEEQVPISPDIISVTGQSEFAPEMGQSLATATQDGVNRLARKIVNMMETPW